MSENHSTEELIRRLLLATEQSWQDLENLIAEARSEAEDEIRELVRSAYKASMLRQAVEYLEGSRKIVETQSGSFDQSQGIMGCYVYGIGLTSRNELEHRRLLEARGVDPRHVLESVCFNDLEAIVSSVSLQEFGQDALQERVSDPRWLEEKIRAHNDILVIAMSVGPVIPCRFCTVVRSAEDVKDLLKTRHDELKETLSRLHSKREWGVKAYIDLTVSTKKEPAASGKDYLRGRQLEKKKRESSIQLARTSADECYRVLSSVSVDSTRLSVQSSIQSNPNHLILNSAHLVSRLHEERFQKMVDSLEEKFGPSGMTFEVSGPWPPYNFVNLDLTMRDAA